MNNSENSLLISNLAKTDQDIRDLRLDIQLLRNEIKELNSFKWKVYGIASTLSFIVTILLNYITKGVK